MSILVSVVSLPSSTARRKIFAERAASSASEWSFFNAHCRPSADLEYRENLALISKGRKLTPSEIACYSSHYAVWKKLLASDAEAILVLEDDAVPLWAFIDQLTISDLASMRIDFLRLFTGFSSQGDLVGRINGRRVFRHFGYQYGAVAYILTRRAATRLVEHCRVIRRPIDDEMDRSWAHGVEKFSVYPAVVMEDFTPSTIGNDRWEIPPPRSFVIKAARRALMLSDGLASKVDARAKPLAAKASGLFLSVCEEVITRGFASTSVTGPRAREQN